MSLAERVILDTQRITSNSNEFATPATFISPGGQTIEVLGIKKIHHTALDDMGSVINAKQAAISVAETQFTDQGHSIRNSKGVVSILDYKVYLTASNGDVQSYKVQSTYPDETFGVITCILTQHA